MLLDGNGLFKEFKGALTKQYVLQRLKAIKGLDIYYWTADRGTAEVDFAIDNGKDIIPVEVKAEVNHQAKSLKVFRDKFRSQLSIRISMADYKEEDWLLNLPLWAIELLAHKECCVYDIYWEQKNKLPAQSHETELLQCLSHLLRKRRGIRPYID